MPVDIIQGDILLSKEKYIAHQCNATTNQAGGLAYYIFKQYPYANIYASRPHPYKPVGPNFPGNIAIFGDGKESRFVINMIAQYYPGNSMMPTSLLDGISARETYFRKCLAAMAKINNIESIAFPHKIGCGLAGGDWDEYLSMIQYFSAKINISQNVRVVLYKNDFT